jgi:hypothetical protein
MRSAIMRVESGVEPPPRRVGMRSLCDRRVTTSRPSHDSHHPWRTRAPSKTALTRTPARPSCDPAARSTFRGVWSTNKAQVRRCDLRLLTRPSFSFLSVIPNAASSWPKPRRITRLKNTRRANMKTSSTMTRTRLRDTATRPRICESSHILRLTCLTIRQLRTCPDGV